MMAIQAVPVIPRDGMKAHHSELIYRMGWECASRGSSRDFCPYFGNPQRASWLAGWDDANEQLTSGDRS